MTVTVTPADLGTYLGVDGHLDDDPRATLIVDNAVTLCQSIASPLPDGSESVVLDVAARAWTNPANAQQQGSGPYSVSFGAVSGGLWLTRQNKATLRRLAGGGGVVAVDMTPDSALQDLPWWDTNVAPDAAGFDVVPDGT